MSEHREGRHAQMSVLATAEDRRQCIDTHPPSPAPQQPSFLENLPGRWEIYEPTQPITQDLKQIIEDNAYQGAFQSAIDAVSRQRIPELDRIHTLSQFYFLLDALLMWIPELRVWEWQGDIYHERTDYVRLMQFYYYFNQRELAALQSPIAPVAGKKEKLTPISRWLRDFAVGRGEFLDKEDSADFLETYKWGPEYAYQDYAGGEDRMDYPTFNAWFSRQFRDIDAQRPVSQPDDDRIITFPAESTFVGQWPVSTRVPEGQPMPAPPSVVVKHVAWPITELLADSDMGDAFEGGIFIHSFLNIFDYHRQHAPASGKILEAKFIPGQAYLQVDLQILDKEERAESNSGLANAVIAERHLNAEDNTGYQFVQCRGLFVLETAVGKIAVLPMGMGHVSSVVFVKPGTDELIRLSEHEKEGLSYEEQVARINTRLQEEVVDKTVRKGEMISTFLFGGSDIVMVFDRDSAVNITAQPGVHYPIRSQLAVSNIGKLRPL